MRSFFVLRLKITSWACLVVPILKFAFHWVAHLFIPFKFLLKLLGEVWMSCITQSKDLPSQIALAERPS